VKVKSPNRTKNLFSDWGTLKHGVPQGSILVSLLFIIYINDLHLRINTVSEPILVADDTSVISSSRYFENFYCVKFQQWEDYHSTKENHQKYSWCTTQNFI
jgi:hypothetical protein